MQPHQERVVVEKKELDDKVGKLRSFLFGEIFKGLPPGEQGRLKEQLSVMERYSEILGERISAF